MKKVKYQVSFVDISVVLNNKADQVTVSVSSSPVQDTATVLKRRKKEKKRKKKERVSE